MISFKQLEQFLENATLNLVIKKTESGLVVSVLPQPNIKDKAKENLVPLVIKGTAEELDKEFMSLIQPELTSVTGIVSNIAEFEANAEEMKNKSEAAKKEKEAKKKLNEASKKALEGADKLLEESKFDECQKAIDKALKDNPEYKPAKSLQKKLDKANPSTNQGAIFDTENIEEVKEVEQVQSKDEVEVKEIEAIEEENKVEATMAQITPGEEPVVEKTEVTITEIAEASPNVEVVSLPKVETPDAGITPNEDFDNEPTGYSGINDNEIEDLEF